MNTALFSAGGNGVYRAPPDVAPLLNAARDDHLCWAAANLRRVRGKRALMNALARELAFPDTFGGNWDALADALQDLFWLKGRGCVLLLRHFREFAAAAPAERAMLVEILDATADYWRQKDRVFCVLLDDNALRLPVFPAQ